MPFKPIWPIRPAHGVYNAKLSISFTRQSRERNCLFLTALNGSCMISHCPSCLFVPLFHFSQELNVVSFVSGLIGQKVVGELSEFTTLQINKPRQRRFLCSSMIVLLRIGGKCSCLRAKAAHFSGHLPEKGKQRTEEEIRDLQKITGPSLCRMSAQENFPALSTDSFWANRLQILLNSPFTHSTIQLEEFPADALCSPESVV
jgi:hypothetical protein